MRKGNVEIKRIEAKSNRQVTFSKRKGSLLKKARELAVLCDVDVGVIIFSGGGKLYEFSSRNSLTEILDRYTAHKNEEIFKNMKGEIQDVRKNPLEYSDTNLLQLLLRFQDENIIEQLDIQQLSQVEQKFASILWHVIQRKKTLLVESLSVQHKIREDGNATTSVLNR